MIHTNVTKSINILKKELKYAQTTGMMKMMMVNSQVQCCYIHMHYAGSPHKSPGFGAQLWFPPVARLPSMYVCAARSWSAQFNFWCACQQYNGDRGGMDELVRPDGSAILRGGMSWVELQYIWCTVICVIQAVFGFAPSIPTLIKHIIKFSSYKRKFRVEQLQSHIWGRAS
jgi:hypothetical protein